MSEFCGIELAHPVINASGTYDVIAARRVFGDALLADFPLAIYSYAPSTTSPVTKEACNTREPHGPQSTSYRRRRA